MQIGREPSQRQGGPQSDAALDTAAGDAASSIDGFELASHWRSLALAFVQSSRDCVKLIDLEGRVAAMNPSAVAILQLGAPADLLGAEWAELWPEPGRALVENSVSQGLAGAPSSFHAYCPTMRGDPRWWEVTVSPVVDENGAVRCLLSVSRDVTALREREEEMREAMKRQRDALLTLSADFDASSKKLRDAEARASHDDKMRVFGRFVGSVVHDFNNVFAAMHGAARLLRRRVTDATALDIVGHVEKAAERGSGLARQLLDFARAETEPMEVFDVSALLSRDAHLLRHIVSGGATLTVRAGETWPVLGSPQKFQSVLFNLIANARDAVGANGRIEVSLENVGALARPEGLDVADYVRLTVVDNGCGMSPEALRRAGEPFFTTKLPGKGTGLGLASAFELAASCQGRAYVESEAGAGARVSVLMRRSPAAGEVVASPDAAVDPALHGGAKILLVDDDPAIRDHLAAVFRELNYVVVEASAVEIAAAAVETETPFDLVVTDLNLGDGLGDQLVARLRAKQPALPAIYVTGSSGFAIPREETVLRKPVSESRLARAVLEKLGRLPGAAASAEALRQVERILGRIRDPEMKRVMADWADRAQSARRIPSVREPGPWREAMPPLGYLAAVGAGIDPELRFVRVGEELSMRLGRPLIDATLDAGDEQILGSVIRTLRRRLDGAPGYDYIRFALGDGKISTMERLVLPLGDAEGRVSHLFGLVAFGEIDGTPAH